MWGLWLDSLILKTFSNLNDSMILWKWLITQVRGKMYLLPTKWRYKNRGFFFRTCYIRLSPQEWVEYKQQSGAFQDHSPGSPKAGALQCLPPLTSNYPHLHSRVPCHPCSDPHLSFSLLSWLHSSLSAYWQFITASSADCISSLRESGTCDRGCTKTTTFGGKNDTDGRDERDKACKEKIPTAF